jgi:hypothetical protein
MCWLPAAFETWERGFRFLHGVLAYDLEVRGTAASSGFWPTFCLALWLKQAGALDRLEAFSSFNGPDFYEMPRNKVQGNCRPPCPSAPLLQQLSISSWLLSFQLLSLITPFGTPPHLVCCLAAAKSATSAVYVLSPHVLQPHERKETK